MIVCFDSVNVSEIPRNAQAVLGYPNGRFITIPELEQQFPHAERISLSVQYALKAPGLPGSPFVDGWDFETGDLPADKAGELVTALRHERGEWFRPVCYASKDGEMPGVIESIRQHGTPRHDVRLLVADWTGRPGVIEGYDGTQYLARGRYDVSDLLEDFFTSSRPPQDEPVETRVRYYPRSKRWQLAE